MTVGEAERRRLFWMKVEKASSEECWPWRASLDRHGYGSFRRGPGKTVYAHRYAYMIVVGPIPEDLELDHLCRNQACVNPAHLEPVTHAENLRRFAIRRETCRKGLHKPIAGHRQCRECANKAQNERRRRDHLY